MSRYLSIHRSVRTPVSKAGGSRVRENLHLPLHRPTGTVRLQGFTDEQFDKVRAVGISKAQLYKQAGNAVTVTVIEALGRFIRMIDEEREESNEQDNDI